MKIRNLAAVVGVVALAATAVTSTASATGTRAEAACSMNPGAITPSGKLSSFGVTAGSPPTMSTPGETASIFPPGAVRLSTTWTKEPNISGLDRTGYVVEGDSLIFRAYNPEMGIDATTRIGGGWTNFTAVDLAEYAPYPQAPTGRQQAYALRNDGTLFRWSIGSGGWRRTGSAPGFSAVKSMALISKTSTYDTFLANTRGGALYTIRIPITSPMKPIVTKVRTRTWQGFETMIASKCGNYGTLLLGIDKDTNSGYLYAVGHANGLSTVINGLGKVNGTFPNQPYFRWAPVYDLDPLNGD